MHNRGQKPKPYQDMRAIRHQNVALESRYFEKVESRLQIECPDTLERDLIALQGIREQITAKRQARLHSISYSSMKSAYRRIHLLLAAQTDETIIPRRPQQIRSKSFDFSPEYTPIIQIVANELLNQANSDGKMVALYSYLCNIPNRTSARNFQMSESTLRNYRHKIQERLTGLIETQLQTTNITF